jgi:hypothetical protein
MQFTRRGLLAGASAACVAGAMGRSAPALAAGGLLDRRVPGAARDYRILEIFFSGALSHRETFWVERPDEAPVIRGLGSLNPQLHSIVNPSGAPGSWTQWLASLGDYQSSDYRVGTTTNSDIHLGPGCKPLVDPLSGGDRLIDRLRVVAVGHDAPVHEVAQAYLTQGIYDGSSASRISAAGAAITRHSSLPSYVFFHNGLSDARSTAQSARAFGRHEAYNSPIAIPYDDPSFVAALAGARVADRDALSRYYSDEYEAGFTFAHPSAAGLRARSTALDRYLDSIGAAYDGPALAAALGNLSTSTSETLWDNGVRRALRTAISLIDSGQSAHCMVCDAGVTGPNNGFSFYDQHNVSNALTHSAQVTANLLNVMRTLREEIEAGTLNLDDTLVVFNTEFGRAFGPNDPGSNHCPEGFAVALLGGPIATGGVVGRLPFTGADDSDSREANPPALARRSSTSARIEPTDLRAAIYQAAGIHPFQADVYEVHESTSSETVPDDAADDLATTLFA